MVQMKQNKQRRVLEHQRRKVLTSFRLPAWKIEFLLSHPGQGSKMLESALDQCFFDEMSVFYKEHYAKNTNGGND